MNSSLDLSPSQRQVARAVVNHLKERLDTQQNKQGNRAEQVIADTFLSVQTLDDVWSSVAESEAKIHKTTSWPPIANHLRLAFCEASVEHGPTQVFRLTHQRPSHDFLLKVKPHGLGSTQQALEKAAHTFTLGLNPLPGESRPPLAYQDASMLVQRLQDRLSQRSIDGDSAGPIKMLFPLDSFFDIKELDEAGKASLQARWDNAVLVAKSELTRVSMQNLFSTPPFEVDYVELPTLGEVPAHLGLAFQEVFAEHGPQQGNPLEPQRWRCGFTLKVKAEALGAAQHALKKAGKLFTLGLKEIPGQPRPPLVCQDASNLVRIIQEKLALPSAYDSATRDFTTHLFTENLFGIDHGHNEDRRAFHQARWQSAIFAIRSELLRPSIQFEAKSVTLPTLGLEVHSQGEWTDRVSAKTLFEGLPWDRLLQAVDHNFTVERVAQLQNFDSVTCYNEVDNIGFNISVGTQLQPWRTIPAALI